MPIISYAQNREDVLLNRVFPGPTGFYIDVGAALPVDLSVTKLFYDRGWTGINVEPQRDFFRALEADRPRDVNLPVVLSSRPGSLTFYEAPGHEGMATTCPDAARELESTGRPVVRREVPALTLAEVCERYVTGEIDFLKIDVEGAEREVLMGADFTKWRPRIVLIEATEPNRPVPNHHHWEDLILAADYRYAAFDGLNRYYVRAGDEPLIPVLQVPPNVFDDYVPYEQDRWHRSAVENGRNLNLVHAECDRIRAAYDERDAECKRLWDKSKEYWQLHVESHGKFEDAQRRYEEAQARFRDAEGQVFAGERRYATLEAEHGELLRQYEAIRAKIGGVKSVLGRLRDGLRGDRAHGRPAPLGVSHHEADEPRTLASVGGG